MEHQRQTGGSGNGVDAVKVQLGGQLVIAVGIADGYGQGIDSGSSRKILCHFGVGEESTGVGQLARALVVADMAQLAFHRHAHGMADADHFRHLGGVGFVVFGGAIVHDGGEAQLQGLHTPVEGQSVVIVDAHGHRCLPCYGNQIFGHTLQGCGGQQHFGGAHHHGSAQLFGGFDDGPGHLHIYGIEKAEAVAALFRIQQDVVHCNKHGFSLFHGLPSGSDSGFQFFNGLQPAQRVVGSYGAGAFGSGQRGAFPRRFSTQNTGEKSGDTGISRAGGGADDIGLETGLDALLMAPRLRIPFQPGAHTG